MVVSQTTSITPSTHADNHRTGGSDPLTGAVGINSLAPDMARDIIPTNPTAEWSTHAATPANITDGDLSTLSGVFTANGGIGVTEIQHIDLGSLMDIMTVKSIYTMVSGNFDITGYLEGSVDNAAWTTYATHTEGGANGTTVIHNDVGRPNVQIRYLRLRFVTSGAAGTGTINITALQAYKV